MIFKPRFLLISSLLDCSTALYHINAYYSAIVIALYNAFDVCVPQVKQGFFKYWWNEELTLLKESAINSFNLWSSLGKPRPGSMFDDMICDKLRYKLAIKDKMVANANKFSDSLNNALLSKDMDNFWRTWRAKFTKSQLTSVVDGCCDDKDIVDNFANVFQSVCVPNNINKHAELHEEFFQMYTDYVVNCRVNVSVELVDKYILGMKR